MNHDLIYQMYLVADTEDALAYLLPSSRSLIINMIKDAGLPDELYTFNLIKMVDRQGWKLEATPDPKLATLKAFL